MNTDHVICFIHIPKTAGTSLLESLLKPNFDISSTYNFLGLKKFIFDNKEDVKLITGHVQFGLHKFLPNKDTKYITLLREPLERAVSFYYYIREQKKGTHPLHEIANELSLKDFYKLKKFHNWQVRHLAGIFLFRTYSFIPFRWSDEYYVQKSIENLKEHCVYGLTEQFAQSVTLFQNKFSWSNYNPVKPQKKAKSRVDVCDLDNETLHTIKNAHLLDIRLYDFALNNFSKQF